MLTFCPQMLDTTYIYNRAQQNLKQGAFPLLSESQAIIDIHDLSESKKQQILYKHLK
ncbi:nSTAND3 domain-containing NTPase [Photorhabdus asymbiotica]